MPETINIHEVKTHLSRILDRILVAQAQVEGYTLLTSDHQVAQYPGPIRLV